MTNEITQYEEKWIILMKNGLIHWVSKETGERASEYVGNQTGHSFIRIKELNNISLNTAEMHGVYDHPKYVELCRVRSGEWQCAYGKWHPRKGECQCKADYYRKQTRKKQEEEEREKNKPQTPEEQARSREAMTRMNEMAALNGDKGNIFRSMYSIGNKSGRKLRRKTIGEWEKETGRTADLTGLAIEEEGENTQTP